MNYSCRPLLSTTTAFLAHLNNWHYSYTAASVHAQHSRQCQIKSTTCLQRLKIHLCADLTALSPLQICPFLPPFMLPFMPPCSPCLFSLTATCADNFKRIKLKKSNGLQSVNLYDICGASTHHSVGIEHVTFFGGRKCDYASDL